MRYAMVLVLCFAAIFVSGCVNKDVSTESNYSVPSKPVLVNYKNMSLGISFSYPSTFVVDDQSDGVRIESDYVTGIGPTLGMNIIKISPQHESRERINQRLAYSGKAIENEIDKGEYELMVFDDQYYILSDKGTFYVGDSTSVFKQRLEQEGLYQYYKDIFNQIVNSVKIV